MSATIDNQTLSASVTVVQATPAPTLTSISPASGVQGTTVPVTLTGTNFANNAMFLTNNAGITVGAVTFVSTTQLTATFTILPTAAAGAANVTVSTGGGTSGAVVFTVIAATGQEVISTPAVPSGPTSGIVGTLYQFSASGSTSNLSHVIQYAFDWGDGTHSGWTPLSVTSSNHAWSAPGTYTVRVQARCTIDTTVLSAESAGLAVVVTGESISAPSAPAGPASGGTGTSYSFSTGGAVSSLGHTVQYRIYFGDGADSGWLPVGTLNASHIWYGVGTYTVTALARCSVDTFTLSPASAGTSISIAVGETISAPAIPTGPTTGTSGTAYTYSTGGATASTGAPVVYLFDWGDGHTSGWLPAGATTASHTWASAGAYNVTAYAADLNSLAIQSGQSGALAVGMN
jgi:hypothetical protein